MLLQSIQRLLAFPKDTKLFLCHDYPPAGREPNPASSVAAERAGNAHLRDRDRAAFIDFRQRRDAGLPVPRLLLPSLQVNLRGGRLPAAESNGTAYLKVPLSGALEPIAG